MSVKKAKEMLPLSGVDFGQKIQFLASHGWWAKHLAVCNLQVDDLCQLCGGEGIESPEHLLLECPGLTWARQNIFGVDFFDSGTLPHRRGSLDYCTGILFILIFLQ